MDRTAASIADGMTRQLDPRWIPVRRIHDAIFFAVLSMPSFVGVIVLWVASRMLVAGLVLVPVWAVVIAAFAWQLYRWPADLLSPRVVLPRRRGLRDHAGRLLADDHQRPAVAGPAHRRVAGATRAPLRPGHAGDPHRGHDALAGDAARPRFHGRPADPRPPAPRRRGRCRLIIASIRRRSCSRWRAA